MISIGIDLGTTNSSAAFHDGKSAFVIDLPNGARTLPSVVSIANDGRVFIGERAQSQMKRNTEFTFHNFKRLMGLPWNDNIDMGPQVVEGPRGLCGLRGPDRVWLPEELSALILSELKTAAEVQLGREVGGVVVTVPAYFNDKQKAATISAAQVAGFEEVELLGEPNAAALASGLDQGKHKSIFVFDLGGGTFDVAVIETGRGSNRARDTNGDMMIGGVSFDAAICKYAIEKYKKDKGVDISIKPMQMLTLQQEAERAKRFLTDEMQTQIEVPFAGETESGAPLHLSYPLTREEVEGLCVDIVQATLEKAEAVLLGADRPIERIDHIVLVGGMTRMPLVRHAVTKFFGGREPERGINPDIVVAQGAAIQAAKRDNRISGFSYEDIVSLSYGIETPGGSFMPIIPKGSRHNVSETVRLTSAADNQAGLAIGIYQGEGLMADENDLIASHWFPLANPDEAGVPVVSLTMSIDDNGMLAVSVGDDGDELSLEIGESNADDDSDGDGSTSAV